MPIKKRKMRNSVELASQFYCFSYRRLRFLKLTYSKKLSVGVEVFLMSLGATQISITLEGFINTKSYFFKELSMVFQFH